MQIMTLRKIHRWSAVLIGAFILFQGLTGAVSQQRFALLAFSDPDFYAVSQVTGSPLSPDDIIKAVRIAKPDFRPAHVMLPMDNSPATAAIVMGGRKPQGLDMSRSVTVDQYSGEIIGEQPSAGGWVGTITGWHQWANYGVGGRLFLSFFGLATMMFLFTGILLWSKSRSYAAKLSLLARFHRGAGIVVAMALVIVASTGVAMNLATWKERNDGASVVASNMRAGMRTPTPLSSAVSLSDAWNIATKLVPEQRLAAFSDVGSHAGQYWFAFTDSRLKRTDVLVHPETGEPTVYPSGLIEGGTGLRGWLYSVHTGYVFGESGGILMTVIGCLLLFWPISGLMMWRRRTT